MADRITYVETIFREFIDDGMPKLGIHVLDHGVCSGLIQLLHSTLWNRVANGLTQLAPAKPLDQRAKERFLGQPSKAAYEEAWWFTAVLWGTAAAAVHNILQLKELQKRTPKFTPLSIDEDPLAYLGILVDILQEWDRYKVSPDSVFIPRLPLQGSDVKLGTENDIVRIDYGEAEIAKDVREALSISLAHWEKLVAIEPPARTSSAA